MESFGPVLSPVDESFAEVKIASISEVFGQASRMSSKSRPCNTSGTTDGKSILVDIVWEAPPIRRLSEESGEFR